MSSRILFISDDSCWSKMSRKKVARNRLSRQDGHDASDPSTPRVQEQSSPHPQGLPSRRIHDGPPIPQTSLRRERPKPLDAMQQRKGPFRARSTILHSNALLTPTLAPSVRGADRITLTNHSHLPTPAWVGRRSRWLRCDARRLNEGAHTNGWTKQSWHINRSPGITPSSCCWRPCGLPSAPFRPEVDRTPYA